ncbi:MAG: sigma-70 family RNA polymerase sigma factor [Limnochordia bacterium]|jgi:RNA polymerase sporulation-specific sigma factor|nr:sigma-70 family RNA polymerase sigma factor [Bacillota bacterium]HOB08420.1 sigma-70 family RNA polymerase sigma factor [Limnochordia bacterium]NLH30264.1 sigma-70 family RNA polymerase sigma factor [Bacillota bacterium]HPT92221.1 sigma-70 family RNA polymerase sigma factor [Limnochordia bacterium]HPZ30869.1 sigma-70 family RNA polymerase sigma factor [Limnochordia bacterium]
MGKTNGIVDSNQQWDYSLITRIRLGDEEAKETLVLKYIPMVKHIVRNYYASFLDFDDLLQEGIIGLLHAIDEYRPDLYDVKFSSFAYICIIRKIYNVIKHTSGNKHKALNDAMSLQSQLGGDDSRTVLDLISDDNSLVDPEQMIEEEFVFQYLDRLLANHLSLLEYTVMKMLLSGYSCGEIEAVVGVGAKVVDNARTRVKTKLRKLIEEYGSLLNPQLPLTVRKRKDLYLKLGG